MSSSKPSPQQQQQQRANEWWSDGETAALIDAWDPLHVARSRGPLPAKDWRAAASAVNARRAAAGRRHNRTRARCRARVQTLKERYKRELAKPPPSGWRHFSRLQEFLLSGPPPGFPPKTMPPASVKKEEEECQDEAVGGGGGSGGLLGRWGCPDEAEERGRGVVPGGGGGDEAGRGVRARGVGEAGSGGEGGDGDGEGHAGSRQAEGGEAGHLNTYGKERKIFTNE